MRNTGMAYRARRLARMVEVPFEFPNAPPVAGACPFNSCVSVRTGWNWFRTGKCPCVG